MSAALTIDDLHLGYSLSTGYQPVVQGFSLHLPAGQTACLLGAECAKMGVFCLELGWVRGGACGGIWAEVVGAAGLIICAQTICAGLGGVLCSAAFLPLAGMMCSASKIILKCRPRLMAAGGPRLRNACARPLVSRRIAQHPRGQHRWGQGDLGRSVPFVRLRCGRRRSLCHRVLPIAGGHLRGRLHRPACVRL